MYWFTVDSDWVFAEYLVVGPIEDVPVDPINMLKLASVLHCLCHSRAAKVCDQAGDQQNVEESGSQLWFLMCIHSFELWFIALRASDQPRVVSSVANTGVDTTVKLLGFNPCKGLCPGPKDVFRLV